jgi:DNA polymerase bacteriophage-type
MKNVHLDFETSCELDLSKVGLYRYIEHPSFRPLCVAWKMSIGNPVVIRIDDSGGLPPELHALLSDSEVQGHAWNSAFEERILEAHYGFRPARRLSCTMQRALAYGLPGKLERAGPALGCRWVKDAAGRRLMLKMSRDPYGLWTEAEWAGLLAYCQQDVRAEEEIAGLIPQLSHRELELSRVDRSMNNAGIWLDVGTVKTLIEAAREAEKDEKARAAILSQGIVTNPGTQTERLTKWLQDQGLNIMDVSRPAVEEALTNGGLPCAKVEEMLSIRLRVARASVKKLSKMIEMLSAGDRLRGQFQYHGAGRTGRWAGRGVQCQNLPRVPPGFAPLTFMAMARVNGGEDLDAVTPAPTLDCVSWSLRACLGAQANEGMWSFDFSQIEARTLAWLAGQENLLEVFRSGEDPYIWAAGQFGSQNRQLGKVLILALGYGMGARKLRETAQRVYAVRMTEEEAEKFKTLWRRQNPMITAFWREIEAAAKGAVLQRGRVFPVLPSTITLSATERTLKMALPSGRCLYYHRPSIAADGGLRYWGEEKGQWVERRTWGGTLAENCTQAVARDIMAEAMTRVAERTGAVPLMTVHDEIVYAAGASNGALEKLVRQSPSWAGGLPIDGEVKLMSRYGVVMKR